MPAPSPGWPTCPQPEPSTRPFTVAPALADTLTAAGSGNDILIGDAGHDTLVDSGTGHNILIGAGAGGNTVTGNGNDILIGGTTNFDSNTPGNIVALDTILAEWTSNTSYPKRITAIEKGIGFRHRDAVQLPHDPNGYEGQHPLRWENAGPELQLVPREQTGQCDQETQRNQDHHLTT